MPTMQSTAFADIWQTLVTDGATCAWARLRHTERATYEDWLEERDMIGIIAALERLSDRELQRIGMNRKALGLDVSALIERVRRESEIGCAALSVVESDPAHRIAAE